MKRAERQYALVDLLRGSTSPYSAARLAREFRVSQRTIERDIQSLQFAGVPIYADYGVGGGYSILRDYSLPPLNLTGAEALAVVAGLGLLASSPYASAARRARSKIFAIIATEQLGQIREALSAMHVIDAPPVDADAVSSDLLSDAVMDRRVVRLTYSAEDGSTTRRAVETMGLLRGGDSWMLVGWCRLRDGIRGFRIERIGQLEITDEVAPLRDPALLTADLARWRTRRLSD